MKLFIGCSSSDNIPKEYFDDCKVLLEELMKDNDLVFGACNSGLMGLAYNTAISEKRQIIGICPEAYKDDFKNLECNIEITTKSVSERTDNIIEYSDALIFLPGGIGTIYELLTAIESKRCKEFDKPIVIYNSNGFYDNLLNFINELSNKKFLNYKDKYNFLVTNSVSSIKYYINNYKKLKKNQTKLGYSYEEICDIYRITNGFSDDIGKIDSALMQFVCEDDEQSCLRKIR